MLFARPCPLFFHVVAETAEISHRRVQPHVEELFLVRAGNGKAEIGRVARDVPVRELVLALGAQPFLHFVRRLRLERARARPALQETLAACIRKPEKVMLGGFAHGLRARHRRVGVVEIGGRVGGAAYFAGVAVLILGAALRALALDVAVRQEHFLHRVVELLHRAHRDQVFLLQLGVDVLAEGAVLRRIGAVVVIEADVETGKIPRVLTVHALDQLPRRNAFLVRAQHDRRAVGVVGADVMHLVAQHSLQTHPDIGLNVFDQVADVDGAVGVRQRRGDEDFAAHYCLDGRKRVQPSPFGRRLHLTALNCIPQPFGYPLK